MAINSKTKNRKTKFVQVYMTDEEFALLEQMASESGISKTEYMRRLFIKDGEQFHDRQSQIQHELQPA